MIHRPHSDSPPILEVGDHLTFDQYEQRSGHTENSKRFELVEGRVTMNAAMRYTQHNEPLGEILTLITLYRLKTPGVASGIPTTVLLDAQNAPEPDAFLRILPEFGGRVIVNDKGYLSGAPELIIEIAASSVSIDLFEKKTMYERFGVEEYLVWRTEDAVIDCFDLQHGKYVNISPAEGIWKSRTFGGLWFDTLQLAARNFDAALVATQAGLNSSDHHTFAQRLSQKRSSADT